MSSPAVLDSYAILTYLEKERGADAVSSILKERQRDGELLMNSINAGEVYYILARERSGEKADMFINIIVPALNIQLVENSMQDVIEAARIKAAHQLSFADAFAVATAVKHRATLVTGDPEFRSVVKMVNITWIC